MNPCKKCGSTEKYTTSRHCKPCRLEYAKQHRPKTKEARSAYMKAYNLKNKDRIRDAKFQRKYGLTLTEYDLLWEKQGRKCYVCWATDRTFHLDHCHKTNKVRGILCSQCNHAIGLFQDNPNHMRRAADYVELS